MIPDGTVFWGVVLKQLILGLSAFSTGVLLYRAIIVERHRRRPFLVAGLLGVAVELLLISELVVRAPLVNPDWRAIAYLVGLVLIGVGFLGDAVRQRRRYRLEAQLARAEERLERDDARRDR